MLVFVLCEVYVAQVILLISMTLHCGTNILLHTLTTSGLATTRLNVSSRFFWL